MVKTIASPIVNQCVSRNYGEFTDKLHNNFNIPLLMIASIDPLIRDANDWQARFETVKNTFSSRVGQISNAALNRSIIAYNENSTAEERERYRQEVEILAILTGLDIDSAKSGVNPDLSKYLAAKDIKRSLFLRFKDIMDAAEEQRKWYEPTPAERLKAYYEKPIGRRWIPIWRSCHTWLISCSGILRRRSPERISPLTSILLLFQDEKRN